MSELDIKENVNEAIDRIQKEVQEAGKRFDVLMHAGQQQAHTCNCGNHAAPQRTLAQFVAELVEQEMESMNVLKSLSTKEMIDDTVADAYIEHLTNVHNCFMVAVSALR